MKRRYGIKLLARLAFVVCTVLGVSSRAQASETFWIEGEAGRGGANAKITSPLLIKDDNAASNGSYIEVLAGNDSKTTMPASEGVTSLNFITEGSGTFRIWARVQAPTDGDDSFWVKMDNGSAIKWNEIPLGSSWHWVLVKAEGASNPATFSLSAGAHTLNIAYREDGTRLDAVVVTSDNAFDPTAPLTGAPATPILDPNFDAATSTTVLMSWNSVPGAQSYTVRREGNIVATGVTGHTFTSSMGGCFTVVAVASTGTSADQGGFGQCISLQGFIIRATPTDIWMSATAPMSVATGQLATDPGTAESLFVVPAHGRGRLDFRVAATQQIKVWAITVAPDVNNDSFWVRVDQGTWIRWNGFPNGECDDVHDSQAPGVPPVIFNLSAGSHFVEFAYREVGAKFHHLAVAEQNNAFPCAD
jgi:hypothetical protein